MFGVNANQKCLITITKDFKSEFDDELTVSTNDIVQLVEKLDRYWFQVYHDGRIGKVPISNCREWNATEMAPLKLIKSTQTAFISKYDFCKDLVDGDLQFAALELLIGFQSLNDDWWYGTRLSSVVNHVTSWIVKNEHCGIFPLTHVWRLREDLLPENVFTDSGVVIQTDNIVPPPTIEKESADDSDEIDNQTNEEILFYVKVVKTMKAHLEEEMDLPQIEEVLAITSIPDNLYYFGKSLDGTKQGLFPKNFVVKIDNYEMSPSPALESNPPSIPPPSPPAITLNFGKHLDVEFSSNSNNQTPMPLDTPPSYEAAISCEPLSYGYANHMFSEVESYGRVLFDFDAQNDNELTLKQNQIVQLYRHVDDGWMEGEINGQIGFFPKSYISIIVDCNVNASVETEGNIVEQTDSTNQVTAINYPLNTKAKILYDFDPEMEQDLRVRTGDVVTLLKHFTTTNWIEAMDSSGNVGFIHLDFCQLISDSHISENSTINYPNLDQFESKKEDYSESKFNPICDQVTKPQRAAPPAPRRTNIFPTFNQFLLNEKQEMEQYELEQANASNPITEPSVSEPEKNVETTKRSKRQCVITELIQTERDYCHALSICLNVFRTNSAEAERCKVDIDRLLGDMRTVVNVSKSLIKLLENYANNRAHIDQRVGVCFLDLKFEIKDAYTRYCRNHDSMNMLLRFYYADGKSSEFIRRCQVSIQDQTNCFDIASIIIKPVQRILKYPLLLNELIKCTEENHVDWDPLLLALQMITDIATSINEHKRRHDLIVKYCKDTDTSFSGRLKNLNKHTVIKKGSRLANRVLSTITFSNVHKDVNFDSALCKFSAVEKSIKSFIKTMKEYLISLNEYYMQALMVSNTILDYYGSKLEVERLRSTHQEIFSKSFEQFKTATHRNVIESLSKLVDKFKAPWILINKRKDKLIDYDASLKSKNESAIAKSTFEALNQQLIEELPQLTDLSLEIFTNCLKTFIHSSKQLIMQNAKYFLELHQLPLIVNSPFGFYQDIEEAFRVRHSLILNQIVHDISLIHLNAFTQHNSLSDATSSTVSTLSRLNIHRSSNSWKHSLPVSKPAQVDSSNNNEQRKQEENDRRTLEMKYKQQDLYLARSSYIPNDIYELYVEAKDLIGVIKRKDPSGLEHRWFVDRGNCQGFVPKSILSQVENSPSIDYISNLPILENSLAILTETNRYDSVPDEDVHSLVSTNSKNSSLLSFEEIGPQNRSIDSWQLTEFDPLTAIDSNKNNEHNNDNIYYAAYAFKGGDPNQLSLQFSQKVTVKQKSDVKGNKEWWLVESTTGQLGYVPANYLKKGST